MAENESKAPVAGGDEAVPSDWQKALVYAMENPRTVLAAVAFVVLCAVAGALYSLNAAIQDQHAMTLYATALDEEDAAARAEELQKVAAAGNRWSAEALYLAGEAAIEAKVYDKARELLERVVNEHGKTPFAPQAAEALAFLDENDGKLEEALAGYTKIFETWDNSFTGRRQPINMGRIQEALGQLPEAVASYEKQVEIFADSSVAMNAERALARLRSENPALFPDAAAEAPADAPATAEAPSPAGAITIAPETAPAETPEPDAPSTEAPASEVPAAEPTEAELPESDGATETEAPAEDAEAPEAES